MTREDIIFVTAIGRFAEEIIGIDMEEHFSDEDFTKLEKLAEATFPEGEQSVDSLKETAITMLKERIAVILALEEGA